MSSGGKRTPGEGKTLGAPKKRETTTKTFRFPLNEKKSQIFKLNIHSIEITSAPLAFMRVLGVCCFFLKNSL